jgi:tRNA modification GTPase
MVYPKADLPDRGVVPAGSVSVSSVTHEGLPELLRRLEQIATSVLPSEGQVALNRRQAMLVAEAKHALESAGLGQDLVLVSEGLRLARTAFDRLTGRAGVEDVLDALFGRFCLGK